MLDTFGLIAMRAAAAAGAGTATTALKSAFERHKALRRNNNKHYGHRSHKKKYKDYLRYAMSATTQTIMPTAMAAAAASDVSELSMDVVDNAINATATTTTTTTATPTSTTATSRRRQAIELTNPHSNNNYYVSQQQSQQQEHADVGAAASVRAEKLRLKHAKKLEAEKLRGLPASPIFVVANRNVASAGAATATADAGDGDGDGAGDDNSERSYKPFYEGQINYYVETNDDDDDEDDMNGVSAQAAKQVNLGMNGNSNDNGNGDGNGNGNGNVIINSNHNSNWYGRVSPVLRNGIKSNNLEGKQQLEQKQSQQQQPRRYHHAHRQHYHHHHQQHHRQQQQQHNQHHHQRSHRQQHQREHLHHHKRQHQHQHQRQLQQQLLQQQQPQQPQQRDKHYHQSTEQRVGNPYQRQHLLPATVTPDATNAQPSGTSTSTLSPTHTPLATAYRRVPSPHAGAMRELGHQITEMEELERYYAKWPHLARVQFQVYDEHYREAHPELYADYDEDINAADEDEDYESAAELEEAQSSHGEDANLPPYIKKYNRRNKQLLDLLEGTLPPVTRTPPPLARMPALRSWSSSQLQPGPRDSSADRTTAVVRIDDDYLKAKRRRYHHKHGFGFDRSSSSSGSGSGSISTNKNRANSSHHFKDLFAQQRDASQQQPPAVFAANSAEQQTEQPTNQLPDEDVSISVEHNSANDEPTGPHAMWRPEIETKSADGSEQMSWQIEKLTPPPATTTSATPTTPKAAIFRLPSYPGYAGSFIGKPRSRSAQFAPSASGGGGRRSGVGNVGRGSSFMSSVADWHSSGNSGSSSSSSSSSSNNNNNNYNYNGYNNYKSMPRFTAYDDNDSARKSASQLDSNSTPVSLAADVPSAAAADNPPSPTESSPKPIPNSFVYHRVMDAAPRLVGVGATGYKQRLPFVAITDRRLENSKKALLERQKDFEQNHFPMP